MKNADKTTSMETIQLDSGCNGQTAAARKPHQWKCCLTWLTGRIPSDVSNYVFCLVSHIINNIFYLIVYPNAMELLCMLENLSINQCRSAPYMFIMYVY